MDETGLFYRMLPDRALASHAISGRKKDKTRITVSVCVNADGSDKQQLIVIGTAKKPRCFKGINMDNLCVLYRSNASAWMTAHIFTDWILDWERKPDSNTDRFPASTYHRSFAASRRRNNSVTENAIPKAVPELGVGHDRKWKQRSDQFAGCH